jgi:hypothetical protein
LDPNRAFLVICITLVIVVGVNAVIFSILRRGNEAGQIELLRRAASRAKQPWAKEEEALEELSKRVAELKAKRERASQEKRRGHSLTENGSDKVIMKRRGRVPAAPRAGRHDLYRAVAFVRPDPPPPAGRQSGEPHPAGLHGKPESDLLSALGW